MPRAVWNDAEIARSDDVTVVDGYTYFPTDAVDERYLRPSNHRTVCPWKGTARYYDVVVGDRANPAAAWCYPEPSRRAAPLVGGRIAFWRGVRIEPDEADGRRAPGAAPEKGLLARLRGRLR